MVYIYNPIAFRGVSLVSIARSRTNCAISQRGHELGLEFSSPSELQTIRSTPIKRSYEERFKYGMFQRYLNREYCFQFDFARGLSNGLIAFDKLENSYVQLSAAFLRSVNEALQLHGRRRAKSMRVRSKTRFLFPGFAACAFLCDDDDEVTVQELDERTMEEVPLNRAVYRPTTDSDDWWVPSGVHVTVERPSRVRAYLRRPFTNLVRRLRALCAHYRSPRLVAYPERICFQMDAHGATVPSKDVAGNVAIVNQQGDSTEVTSDHSYNLQEMCTSDNIAAYDNMVDRWIKHDTYRWLVDKTQDTEVWDILCPFDLITRFDSMADIPNTVPFNVHRYWSGDMTLKFIINSNRFQIGQLQIAWWYEPDLDAKFEVRNNVWCASQTHHVLLDAGSSNEAQLTIPFKFHLPYVTTKKRSDYTKPLAVGRCICRILNPLVVATGGPDSCEITVYWKLSNNKFTGQIYGAIDPPATFQMDTALKLVTGALNSLSTNNMDNPPDNRAPQYLVPTASHSWSAGTNISEPLHSLRLDPNGQVRHQNHSDEMTVSSVTSKYGLLQTITWSVDDEATKQIWSCDAAPIVQKENYRKFDHSKAVSELNSYVIPPVGVVASLYNYWRGDLEFRFDFISSMFHTGSIVVGYVPGATSSTTVTLDTVLAGPHIVFSLTDGKQLTYTVPYIADRPFWGRKYLGNYIADATYVPSRVYMFVLNKLVNMQSIINKVYINVYMRGASSFEVSVPVQPSLGCGFNCRILYKATELVYAVQGYAPYYAGYSSSVVVGTQYPYVLRYGQASNQVAYFDSRFLQSTTKKYYYKIADESRAPLIVANKVTYKVTYGVLVWWQDDKTKGAIMILCTTEANAKVAALNYDGKLGTIKGQIWIDTASTTQNTYSDGDPGWVVLESKATRSNSDSEYDIVELATYNGERDATEQNIIPTSLLPSSSFGNTFFAENFFSLKDLCRRYNYYCNLAIMKSDASQYGECSYTFHVLPQGLDLQLGTVSKINEIANRCRDGVVAIVASGYRYYRGSMRIRLVAPTDLNAVMWVQHRPDRKLRSLIPIRCDDVVTAEGVFNYGYASYIQDLGVNSIVEIEVPFYQNSSFGLLQRPSILKTNEAFYYSLGELTLGLAVSGAEFSKVKNMSIGVFSAIGDDMAFSTFQGFPPMVFLDDISAVAPAVFQGAVSSRIRDDVTEAVRQEVSETVNAIAPSVEASLSPLLQLDHRLSMLKNSIFQIFQVIANPNIKSFAIAVCALLVDLGLFVVSSVNVLSSAIISVLEAFRQYVGSGIESNPPGRAQAVFNGPSIDTTAEAATGLITMLWTAFGTLMNVKVSAPKNMEQWRKLLVKDMKDVLTSSNAMFTFLRNIFSVLSSMKEKALGIVSPHYLILRNFSNEYVEYRNWAQTVLELRDPVMFQNNKFKQQYKLRVTHAYEQGKYYLRGVAEIPNPAITRSIQTIYNYIHELRESLIEYGSDAFVRKEPFSLWIAGPSGVGKSTLADSLCMRLLRKVGITSTTVPPVYIHDCQSQYWDACNNNPIMRIDDMFHIREGEILNKQLATLFAVVSPVVLCPVKPRIDDKGLPYNPEIFCVTSNYDFIAINNVHMEAIHRRRHVLVQCKLAPLPQTPRVVDGENCPHCLGTNISTTPAKFLSDYHHLEFQFAPNVLQQKYDTAISYDEFAARLEDIYVQIKMKNEDMYRQRLADQMAFVDSVPLVGGLDDYTDLIRQEIRRRQEELAQSSLFSALKDCAHGLTSIGQEYVSRVYSYMVSFMCDPVVTSEFDLSRHILTPEQIQERVNNNSTAFQAPGVAVVPRAFSTYNYSKVKNMVAHYYGKDTVASADLDRIVGCNCISYFHPEVYEALAVSYESEGIEDFAKVIGDCGRLPAYRLLVYMYRERTPVSTKYRSCRHWKLGYDTMIYNEDLKAFYVGDTAVASYCQVDRTEGCLWSDLGFQHLVYCTYLSYNAATALRINTNSKFVASTLPEVFQREPVPIVEQAEWEKVFKDLFTVVWNGIKKMYAKLCQVMEYIMSCQTFINAVLPILMVLGVTGISVYAGIRDAERAESYYRRRATWSMPQANAYGTPQPGVNLNSHIPTATRMQGSPPQYSVAVDRVKRNLFTITAVIGDRFVQCTGMVLKGRECLVLRHYIEELDSYTDARYYGKFANEPCATAYGLEFEWKACTRSYYEVTNDDGAHATNYVLVFLPLKFHECKSLVPFIATSRDHEFVNGDGCLVDVKNNCIHTNLHVYREKSHPIAISGEGKYTNVVLQDVYTYKLQGRGMCGSVLMCPSLERPIIGVHVAGVESHNVRGIAEPLCFETFETLPPSHERLYVDNIIPTLTDAEFSKVKIDAQIYPYGCVEQKYVAVQSGQTQYIPSLIQGVFPILTEPNPLSPSDPRIAPHSPLYLGCAHMGKPPRDFPRELLRAAREDLQAKLLLTVRPVRATVGVVSLQDAVCGNKYIKGFEPLEWSTSPGFPLRFERDSSRQTGKKWLFDMELTEDGYVLKGLHPKLQRLLTVEQAMRARNIKPFTVFIDCLKDTCLPKEKCTIPGKTRIFSISPVQFTIVFKQYFLDFMASYQEARFTAEHAIGIDCDSSEWTDLAGYLTRKGSKIICGDYKNFGPGLMLSAAHEAFEIILRWYEYHGDGANNDIRRILIAEILGAFHLCFNLVYTCPCGIPSGSPITAPLNSLVNSLYIRCAWRFITNLSFVDMVSKTNIITYGDDICISVHDSVAERFNTETISEFFKEYNIVFTDYDKSNNIVKYRDLLSISFLKRKFLPHPIRPGEWLAALDKISIEGCANWIHRCGDHVKATIEVADQCAKLAYGHGPDYYDYVVETLSKALHELDLREFPVFHSWKELDSIKHGEIHTMCNFN